MLCTSVCLHMKCYNDLRTAAVIDERGARHLCCDQSEQHSVPALQALVVVNAQTTFLCLLDFLACMVYPIH